MRLALLTGAAPRPGTEGWAYQWIGLRAAAYREAGHDACVVAPPVGSVKEEDREGVSWKRLPVEEAVRFLEGFSPDLLLIHHITPWTMKVANRVSYRKMFWIYGPEVTPSQEYYLNPHKITRFFLGIQEAMRRRKWAQHFASGARFVCTSKSALERLLKIHPKALGTVIYNPVEMPEEVVKRKRQVLRGLALESLSHRTLLPSGIDLLIKLFAYLDHTTLTLVGTGDASRDLAEWVAREKSRIDLRVVKLTRSALAELLQEHDYLVIPSRVERQVFLACQAMAWGLPPVAPRLGAFPEIVMEGQTGALFDPLNPSSLYEAVSRVLQEHAALGHGAREWAEKHCLVTQVVAEELKLLESAS